MNFTSIAIGIFAIMFGVYTTWIRVRRPEKFGKFDAMKKLWGARPGNALHVIAYTVVPILFGIVMIMNGLEGK